MRITDVSKLRGPLGELHDQLFGESGEERLAELNLWLKGVVMNLLKFVSQVSVSATKRFIAKDHLKAANVGWTGDNFKRLFLNKIETNVEGATLAAHILTKSSLDAPILAELGSRAETKLAYLFQLLVMQVNGQSGVLLTNGYANIFYVRDDEGNLWAVDALWRSGCGYWDVEAFSVGLPFRWDAGDQVFSRK